MATAWLLGFVMMAVYGLPICTGITDQDIICPNGFIRYHRSCYKFSTMRSTWVEAQGYCNILGCSMATVEGHREHKFLVGQIKQHKQSFPLSFWIGGNDIANEGEWRWTSNMSPVVFSAWSKFQPDNGRGNEHCMEMEKRYNYRWNDQPCGMKNHFICELYMY